MHTTTVRFDDDTWELIGLHCQRMGITRSDFIRGAVNWRLGALLLRAEQAVRLEERVARLTNHVNLIHRIVASIAEHVDFRG